MSGSPCGERLAASPSGERLAAVGVDVGGTKVACGLVGPDGSVLAAVSERLDARGDRAVHLRPEDTPGTVQPSAAARSVDQIVRMVRTVAGRAPREVGRVAGCGVAVPAVIDRAAGKVVWAPNIPAWRDFALGPELQDRIGMPVYLDHDGPAAVLGEQWAGAARGSRDVVMLIVGTGIGAGFLLDGRVYRGSHGMAGGVGWFCLDAAAVEDPVYKAKGFLETVAAGPAIARHVREKVKKGATSLATGIVGGDPAAITAEAVFAAANAGDELARRVVARAVRYIAMAVSALVSALSPEVVVLGGGVGCSLGPYLDDIRGILKETAQPQAGAAVRVVTSRMGELAGVIGMARVVLDHAGPTVRPA